MLTECQPNARDVLKQRVIHSQALTGRVRSFRLTAGSREEGTAARGSLGESYTSVADFFFIG
jgi:hypothetical protein